MDKMEVEEVDERSQESNRYAEATTLWSVINHPILGIFSDLTKSGAEQALRSFLESVIRSSSSSNTLFNILIPPLKNGARYDVFEQYTTFTTWLFGVLFHVIVTPLSKENFESTIEIQASMLRILYHLHYHGFQSIFHKYLAILDQTLNIIEHEEENYIMIHEFIVEAEVIKGLDLAPYPVKINSKSITTVFIAIMKILSKSGVMSIYQDVLCEKILRIMQISEPKAKLVAIQLLSNIAQFNEITEKQQINFINYIMEIMKTITPLTIVNLIKLENVQEFSDTLADLLENISATSIVIDLCFLIIELVANAVILSQRVQQVACMTITNYLTHNPRSYTIEEAHRFTKYLKNCPVFSKVIAHFIVFDLKALVYSGAILNIAQSSKLWMLLAKNIFDESNFVQHFKKLLEIARLVTIWLTMEKSYCRFFENPEDLVKRLLIILEGISNEKTENIQMIFMCFIDILTLKEFNREKIQNILCLPWSQENGSDYQGIIFNIAKSKLNNSSKIKCLEGLCQFGRTKIRIKYLCTAINQVDLGVSVILNSIFLLKDPEIIFPDVNTHILKPAFITQKSVFHEALAQALGNFVCVLSGQAKIKQNTWDSNEWHVDCQVCDENNFRPNIKEQLINQEIEILIRPYYLALLTIKSNSIRKIMVKNIFKLSNHLRIFNTNEITNLWLPLIRDPILEIRNELASSIERLVINRIKLYNNCENNQVVPQDEWPEDLNNFIEMIVHEIVKALEEALEDMSKDCQHMTVLKTVREFARVPIYFVEGRICAIFIMSVIHSNSSPRAVASATIAYQQVAKDLSLSNKDLYIRYKKDLMQLIIKMAADNYINKSDNLVTTLTKVATCIGYLGPREFIRKNGHLALSYLVALTIQIPKIQDLFRDVAYMLGTEMKDMFVENFQHIFSHVLINEIPTMSIACLQLMSNISKLSINDLIVGSFNDITRELLLYFHEKMERVVNCLEIISKFDVSQQKKQVFDTQEKLANYLKPLLHAVLVNYDSNLSSTTSDDFTQRSALASLATLIKFMCPDHLSPLKYKILATLRTSLGFTRPGFRDLACYAWDSFIRKLSVEDLGPLLPTICVSLIPLLESYPEKTNSMLEYIIVDNNTIITPYISELFFIEDLKVSTKISNIVLSHIKRAMPKNNFEVCLMRWQRRIIHETDEVRLKALIHLRKFLVKHRSELNNMILNHSNHVHPAIVKILDALLAGCQHCDDEIKLKSGECLGELGAIEPSLLPRRIISRQDSQFIADITNSPDFAEKILVELVRAFQIQNTTQNVGCFSLAIQEIVKTYEISPTGTNKKLWNSLPSTTQQIITPFLESHYKVATPSDIIQYPIYGTESGSTFEKWIFNWACCMITSIKNSNLSRMLNMCRPAFKRDTRTTIFCIPHLVTYTVIEGEDTDRNGLLREFLAVISIDNTKLDEELIMRRPMWNELHKIESNEPRGSDEERRIRCSQVIFTIVDHLRRWLEEKRLDQNDKYRAVDEFFSRLDSMVLAEGCYQSREYHRALMYLERHMAKSKKSLNDSREGGLLAKIYTMLEDPDGVLGILASQAQSPTMQQLLLAHEVNGQLQDAATCYERLAQTHGKPKYIKGMIQCYLGLEQPFTATKITEGMINVKPELESLLVEHEPFWRLAQFSQLDIKPSIKTKFVNNLLNGIQPDLQMIKKSLVSQLGSTSHQECAYQQNYSYIIKMHIINEFEKTMELILHDIRDLPIILKEWEQRLELVRASRGVEFVLRMRRAALDLAIDVDNSPYSAIVRKEIGKIWLKSAKIARKAGLYQQSYMYILSASDHCPSQELHIEHAQLYWQRNNQENAFMTLKRAFSTCFQSAEHYENMKNICTNERKNFAKAKLLFAKYNEETVNVDTETNKQYYNSAVDAWKCWEKSHLTCAQYYESLFDRLCEKDQDGSTGISFQYKLVNNYGKSLQYGCKYIHQSMPRMLTIWMNYALRIYMNKESTKNQVEGMEKMSKIVATYADRLPKFTWLTAFSQLVSRICHPSKEVQAVITKVLVSLIKAYPQHCLWMMASVINSSYPVRQKRCQDILNHIDLNTKTIKKLIGDFNMIWDKLIELSNKTINQKIQHTVSALSKNLPRLLSQSNFGPIMMPTSTSCQLHLPRSKESLEHHNPYIPNFVTITGISEKVVVMISLQRPRRISLIGSDGKKYMFMCKPKDDLRRDSRLMEMNDIVNKYLQKDPESRQRRLYIRTYSVIPLNEECGLVEWIPNLTGFRQAIMDIYRDFKLSLPIKDILLLCPQKNDSLEKKRKIFINELLPRHPAVLGDWFRLNFPDPYGWYEARNAYIRTTAVMSMVGYILGLGDRHGENILLDLKCGDCVHVDFNCLFNKGELLDIPECVPFRLTHNMVEAMGPLGYEGSFRRTCQITMKILRQQTSTLISVLTPFVYDPLVTWSDKQTTSDTVEKTNGSAVKNIKDIELRLKGFVKTQDNRRNETTAVSLSVEGQTNHLILDATNIDNLCQMYSGWTPFI